MLAYAPSRRSLLRAFIDWNVSASGALDRLLFPARWRTSAAFDFRKRIVPDLLRPGMRVWDVGCGSRPMIHRETKRALDLTITGLDFDPAELALIEPGRCDQTVTADLCEFRGNGSADLVICKTVLEHVRDVDRAFAGLVSMLRPGGTLTICVPCRNAWFARLNLLLPERIKQALLYRIWPHKNDGHSGFPAYYDRCTPQHFFALATRHGLETLELRAYWWSTYSTCLVPLWAVWRLWQMAARTLVGDQVAEGFVMVATRASK